MNNFLGEIRLFAGTFAPLGWHFCDGALLSISGYSALFNLLGTTYGGDGVQTFGVPDLRGRVPLHQGNNYVIGQMSGSETVTLLTGNLPSHSHTPQAQGTGAAQVGPAGQVWANNTNASAYTNSTSPGQTMNNGAIGLAGSGLPHENMMPFQSIYYIIALTGAYPTQG